MSWFMQSDRLLFPRVQLNQNYHLFSPEFLLSVLSGCGPAINNILCFTGGCSLAARWLRDQTSNQAEVFINSSLEAWRLPAGQRFEGITPQRKNNSIMKPSRFLSKLQLLSTPYTVAAQLCINVWSLAVKDFWKRNYLLLGSCLSSGQDKSKFYQF